MEPAHPNGFCVRPGRLMEIMALRHEVLRHGLPREAAIFIGDDQPTTRHWVAIGDGAAKGGAGGGADGGGADGAVIGCLTLVTCDLDGETAWQLRGMAVDAQWRNKGVGRKLIDSVYAALRDENAPKLLWCNAREVALDFYRKLGWTIFSDRFDIPTAGPHYKMKIRL